MKKQRIFPSAIVTKKAEISIKSGHPWVYDTEIISSDECGNGELIDVFSQKRTYLGTGLISVKSKIRIRLLSDNTNEAFTDEFFSRRIKYALDYRRTVMADDYKCCRLIFGEADGLPGFTADLYDGIIVTQMLSFGMEKRKEMLYGLLINRVKEFGIEPKGIFERNDVAIRELEGLEQNKGWYDFGPSFQHPESPVVTICENGVNYYVNVENGQKTGFFLDQKYNRLAVAKISSGKKVLDCFTHTGSFAFNALRGGAEHVTAVDVSSAAIDIAKANATLNSYEINTKIDFVCADVFDLLPELAEKKSDYDFIILDPPAFTKSRKTIGSAERGYKEINYRAMKLLPRGGYLATCSCSHFMENEMFIKMLLDAACDANVKLKLIESRRQSPDHPVLLNVPETDYLKFYLFQVV
ncbi:MAG: class I SAM-dependent rRNA methyltransferase [Oscillospiraceae bacterium]|nr:class I SAM-dependent rRNA methyltransferase [Oscillospiraceae bacterium]